ncbi:leukocyte immunoglobulin-like receptor subfamily A member 6 [Trachemys scripta elegans]|uniref:leukocyte immunoglobulin-like receptor subfamily A member 6 n=1 Tax=Trachemys scripta elegans TaxID=31138 RepID=UPI00155399F6|nr:leukocyte immunoglobulin-like receptor subfamily A member 6 [Trachemys scripta elegans]
MASALTVLFLGCWLAGQSRVSGQTYYPKPSIFLSPRGEVTLGGTMTIRCQGQHQNMMFLLYKDGNQNLLQKMETAGDVAEFPIHNVSRRDAGSYSCYYHSKLYQYTWSYPSDPVELVVAEGTDPAGPQQMDPRTTVPAGEGEREKWNNSSPREQGSLLRHQWGHSGYSEGDGPCIQN